MIFSNFSRSISGTTILFKNNTAIEYVKSLKYYKDDSIGSFDKKEFRWSFDNKYWASWDDLTQANISSIDVRNNRYLFFEIRYVKSNLTSSANVTKFSINYLESSTLGKLVDNTPTVTNEENIVTLDTDTNIQQNTISKFINEEFSNFTRTTFGNTIFFKNIKPLQYVKSLKYYKDDSIGSFDKKEFRWSFNNEYWSSWYDLNQGNISSIDIRSNRYLFFEIRYVKISGTDTSNVNNVNITYLQLTATGIEECESCTTDTGTTPEPTPITPDYNIPASTRTTVLNVTNADKLCGQSCDYYLWRPNQKGTQTISTITDLQSILDNITSNISMAITGAENVSGDGFGVFYDVSGNDLLFKRLIAGEGALLSDASGIITIAVDPPVINQDTSINDLYNLYNTLGNDLNDISIYIDSQFIKIDASIGNLELRVTWLESSVGYLVNWNTSQDASIDAINTELSNIATYQGIQDISIAHNDSSIRQLFGEIGSNDASINDLYAQNFINTENIGLVVDAQGTTISVGSKGYKNIGFNGVITDWTLLSDVSGNINIGINKASFNQWPDSSTITNGYGPSLNNINKDSSNNISNWDSSLSNGDILEFTVDGSVDNITKIWLLINIRKI